MGQQTCEMHAAMWAITRRFLCDNIARMGLQHTTNMRDACCPIFARHADAATFSLYQHCKDGLTKHNKNARCIDDRLNVFLCSNIARMVLQNIRDACSPRFLCNNIARMGLQNTTNMRDALMIVWFFSLWQYCKDGLTKHNQHAELYAPQTKILEGRTNFSECVFEALFKGVGTAFGPRNVEKCFENAFWKVGSAFQNLRLGGVNFLCNNIASMVVNQLVASHVGNNTCEK